MDDRRRSQLGAVAVAVALAVLVAWSLWQRWTILDETPFPVGIDGYFYAIQLRSILEGGTLAYPDFPAAFYLMTPFAGATDPVVGTKLAAALFGALIAVPAYGIGAQLGRSRAAGLIAATLATTSAGSMYLTFEFVKNGIGITVALTATWLALRAVVVPSRGRIVAAIVVGLLALATHKMAGVFVVGIATPAAIAEAVSRGALRGRRLLYVTGAIVLLGLGALVAFGVLGLASRALSSTPHLDAPALVSGSRVTLTMGHEAVIGAGLAFIAILVVGEQAGWTKLTMFARAASKLELVPKRSRGEDIAVWTLVVIALAIAFPWLAVDDAQGIGFRVRIIAFVPMALLGGILARPLYAPLAALASLAIREARTMVLVRDIVLTAGVVTILFFMPHRRIEGRIVPHPAMIAAVQAMTGEVPGGDVLVVPERHIMFMVTWYTRTPTRLDPDSVPRPKRWRAMPLAFIHADSPLDELLIAARREPTLAPPIGLHPRHPNGFVLLREPTWEWILARLPPELGAHYANWPTI